MVNKFNLQMAEATGIEKLNQLRRNWVALRLLADGLSSLSVGLLVLPFGNVFGLLAFTLAAGISLYQYKPWRITTADVASLLNKKYPKLEESTELVIASPAELSLLQKIQLTRTEANLTAVPSLQRQFLKPVIPSVLLFISVCAILLAVNKLTKGQHGIILNPTAQNNQTIAEKHLPQIESLNVIITPPAYTQKPGRQQAKFTILAEEGATASWHIETNIPVKQVSLLFNNHETINLKSTGNKTSWTARRVITAAGFYQVNINRKLSDLYPIEVVKDASPAIQVKSPKQYTYIDAGETPQSTLHAVVSDDYGVANAMIFATVAKGSGEGVKFKEYKMPFSASFAAHNRQYALKKLFDLPKLNMEPGDQLYFYIEALDTHQQKTRTDVYTVTIQDTAQLLSMNGLLTGSNIKPEFFRSQRQIILDTEKLMRDRDSLSKEQFNAKSNELATDQKLLRLRYGKFLGEEDESDLEGPANDEELAKAENFSNDKAILDAYTDKHDNAEDATFLEPAVKAQLKATLTEMWKAELQLRLYKPQAALPFEYKALRLLKDLQQKSRAYVAKTAYNPPPLKLEKRMTGDLEKITQPYNRQDAKTPADKQLALKAAVQVLEQLKLTGTTTDADRRILQAARRNLSEKASAEPGIYLKAVSAVSRLISAKKPHRNDIALVEKAIQQSLLQARQLPKGITPAKDMGLSGRYYQNLKRINR